MAHVITSINLKGVSQSERNTLAMALEKHGLDFKPNEDDVLEYAPGDESKAANMALDELGGIPN
jgi:hypothetical protein